MKKKLLLSISLPLIAFVVVFMNSGITHADPFARGRWYGYFHNNLETSGGDLFDGGIYVTDVQSFLNFYWNALYSPNVQDRVSAEFTILTMLGYPAGTGWQVARDNFPVWEQTVRWYGNNGRISWGAMYGYNFNTYYQRASYDVAWYLNTDTRDSIVFYNPNGTSYAIKKDCANPVGDMSSLQVPPPPPPPTVVSCGTMVLNTSKPEIGIPLSARTTVNYSGGPPPPGRVINGASITVAGPGYSRTWANLPFSDNGSTVSFETTMPPGFTVPSTGVYTVLWSVAVNGVSPAPVCGGTWNVNYDSFDVRNYPYISVNGSDTAAGARFVTSPGGSCGNSNQNAGIATYNRNTPPYAGAGTQYGAFAWSRIQEFITNRGNNPSPNSLAFANLNPAAGVNTAAGLYGGNFRQGPCANYWAEKPASGLTLPNPNNVDVGSLPNGVYVHNGNVIINPATAFAPNKKVTLYVTGNVQIRNDIIYGGANPAWGSVTSIPVFKLIAQGVIHIDASTNRLDGVYVAVPSGNNYNSVINSYAAPQPGTISTCSLGFTVRSPIAVPVNPYLNSCDEPLVVNGSFVANHIFFLRAYGTMSGGTAAEAFNFSPEVWLAPNENGAIDPKYQSIVGLPPVL